MAGSYLTNDDRTFRVKTLSEFGKGSAEDDEQHGRDVIDALNKYKWDDRDFLLQSYPKNGAHITWEIMNMLLRGNAEYIKESKMYCMIGITPVTRSSEWFQSPKVINTHYRLDVLPKEFRGQKTVIVMRNGKDTAVSLYKHLMNLTRNLNSQNSVLKQVTSMTFSDFLKEHLLDKDQYYGTHFDYIEYMWSLKDDPNVLIVFYEDLITDTILSIQKINKFMGTGRSDELIEQIADAINIDKMREGKATSMDDATERMGIYRNAKKESAKHVYRKGTVGDWKNYFTVADDELFDSILAKWSGGKDIPFRYTL